MVHAHTVKNLRRFNKKLPVFFITDDSKIFLPLSLGMIRACLEHGPGKDLMGEYLLMPFLVPRAQEFARLAGFFSPGVWLFSNYVWSEKINLEVSRQLKEIHPDNLIIHGGPSVPRRAEACQTFLRRHPWVDLAVLGEGERTALELFSCLAYSSHLIHDLGEIPGIAFLASPGHDHSLFIQTAPRAVIDYLDDLPSPYLTGVLDNLPHYSGAALETTRGCPHHCAYCDWSMLASKRIRRFHLDRVRAEIDWMGRHRITIVFIADANFGSSARDLQVAACLAETKLRYGFPHEVYLSFNTSTLKHTAAIVKNLVNAGLTTQGIIHLQTNDATTLENISRPKIQERYVEGFKNIFEEQGLPLAADLIIGLPGATMASLQGDLQYCFDRDILARPYALYILPNSRLAEPTYRRQFAVEADETGRVCSTASYSREDRQRMKFLHDLYRWFEGRGLLRYVLRHLQWDYAIPALDFIRQFISHLQEFPESCPCVRLGEEFSLAPEVQAGNWGLFYRELAAYILAHYDVRDDAAFRTAFAVNAAAMPRPGRKFPETITLAHDYVGYFLHNRSCAPEDRRRLSQYPAGEFTTTDPHGLCGLDIYHCRQWDAHQFFWELDSPIARKSSAPHFTYAPTIIPGDL